MFRIKQKTRFGFVSTAVFKQFIANFHHGELGNSQDIALNQVETQLNSKIPMVLCDFLRECGEAYTPEIEARVLKSGVEITPLQIIYSAELFVEKNREHRKSGMDCDWIAFGEDPVGDPLVFQSISLDAKEKIDVPIYLYQQELGQEIRVSSGFVAYLKQLNLIAI
jgi:hypothetical protein